MNLAERTDQIQPSQTLAITALVTRLRREGKDVIDLGAGEPDFDTPDLIKEAAIKAIKGGYTHYTPASGLFELKEVICERFKKDAGLDYDVSQIVVTCGAKHAIANLLLALCGKDDEVVVPAPYWTSYIEQVRFVDATPVILETDESTDFKISPDQLAGALKPNTKLLILNSPSNPTGSIYTEEELAGLMSVLKNSDCLVLFDEIYDKLIFDGFKHWNPARFDGMQNRVIVINGASKAFAMTGWRIGYLAAENSLAKAVTKIQSHTTSNPCSISQMASIAAFRAGADVYAGMVEEFDKRRKYVSEAFAALPGVSCMKPKGAFYLFPNVSEYLGTHFNGRNIETTIDLCSFLLEEASVALVPGEAFGTKKHVRISYATSMQNLEKAHVRIGEALGKLVQ